jgi:hypothetical protein
MDDIIDEIKSLVRPSSYFMRWGYFDPKKPPVASVTGFHDSKCGIKFANNSPEFIFSYEGELVIERLSNGEIIKSANWHRSLKHLRKRYGNCCTTI